MESQEKDLHRPERRLVPLDNEEHLAAVKRDSEASIGAFYESKAPIDPAVEEKKRSEAEAKQELLARSKARIRAHDENVEHINNFLAQSPAYVRKLMKSYSFDCVWNAQSQVASINDEAGMRAACERLKKKYPL